MPIGKSGKAAKNIFGVICIRSADYCSHESILRNGKFGVENIRTNVFMFRKLSQNSVSPFYKSWLIPGSYWIFTSWLGDRKQSDPRGR